VSSSPQQQGAGGPAYRPLAGRRLAAVVAATVVVAAALGASAAILAQGSGARSSVRTLPGGGLRIHRKVPALPMLTASGRPITLAAFRGKVVVLAPFLTLCSEVCPLTTGAFVQMQHDVDAAGLGGRVVFVEASVDPWRDSPARLMAFVKTADITFPLLTGTRQEVAGFWRFFGVGYRRVPQGHPPALDWWTHRPQKFDVEHSDALFIIDPAGYEREIMLGMPGGLQGSLTPELKSLLGRAGRADLTNPQAAGWTVSGALRNIGQLLGRPIAQRPI